MEQARVFYRSVASMMIVIIIRQQREKRRGEKKDILEEYRIFFVLCFFLEEWVVGGIGGIVLGECCILHSIKTLYFSKKIVNHRNNEY